LRKTTNPGKRRSLESIQFLGKSDTFQ
jgi:hypothetical protein